MPQYLLNVLQPDGPPPEPAILDPILEDLAQRRAPREMQDAGVWVFSAGLHDAEHGHRPAARGRRGAHDRRAVHRGPRAHRRVHGDRGARTSTPRWSGAAGSPRRSRCRSRCAPMVHGAALTSDESNVSSARSTAARWPSWSASSATSTSPRRRCRTRSPRPSSAGRRRRAAQPGGLDHHHGPQPGDRPAAPRGLARGPARPGRAAARAATGPPRRGSRAGRPPAADLHLLPPVARPAARRSR